MQIREADPSDLDAIANLHARSWRIAYRGILSDAYLDGDLIAERRALWRERFDKPAPNQTIVVAEIDGDMVGLACAFGDHDTRWGTLLKNLHVAPGHKGSGIGAQLVRHIAAWSSRCHTAAGMHLWVLANNTAAQGFYEHLGASQVEESVWDAPDGNRVSEFRFAWPTLPAIRSRSALPSDAARIAELYVQLVGHPAITVQPDRIAAISNDKNTGLFVCEYQGEVRSTALVSLCADVMFGTQPFAVVENVVVDTTTRNLGLGLALLRHVESFCLANDCSKIMLLSAIEREEAHRFFERAGFVGSKKRGFVKYRSAFQTQS